MDSVHSELKRAKHLLSVLERIDYLLGQISDTGKSDREKEIQVFRDRIALLEQELSQ